MSWVRHPVTSYAYVHNVQESSAVGLQLIPISPHRIRVRMGMLCSMQVDARDLLEAVTAMVEEAESQTPTIGENHE